MKLLNLQVNKRGSRFPRKFASMHKLIHILRCLICPLRVVLTAIDKHELLCYGHRDRYGKTLVSAILCKALGADYWKPVQAGFPTDSQTVKGLLGKSNSRIYPETYTFKTPASPHAAAALEGIEIKLRDFVMPKHSSDLVIEGAGGCLVPLNDQDLVIDFF